MDNANPTFVIPRELQPSALRRFMRRTLYLRLLDGQFIMWCFETNRLCRKRSELLSHPRVAVADPQAFAGVLQGAMRDVGMSRLFRRHTILILHCLKGLGGALTPLETQALFQVSRRLGAAEFFFLPPEQIRQMTDAAIVTLCQEVGALRRQLTKKRTR